MNHFPKISIVTPSYNQGAFLERTILSVLQQNYPNLEYIVIDGGSSDNSVAIIEKYAHRLNYWHSKKDKGQTDAINTGLSMASGEIVTWLNSDDCFLPGTLEKVAGQWEKEPFDMLVGNCLFVDENDQMLPEQPKSRLINGNTYRPFSPDCTIHQPGSFFSMKAFRMTGPLDTSLHYSMDVDFWLKVASRGLRFVYTNEVFTYFRRHGQAKSAGGNLQFIEDTLNSRFFKTELRNVNPELYKEVRRSGMRAHLEHLRMEHYSSRLLKAGLRYFSVIPATVITELSSYAALKIGLFLRNRISPRN